MLNLFIYFVFLLLILFKYSIVLKNVFRYNKIQFILGLISVLVQFQRLPCDFYMPWPTTYKFFTKKLHFNVLFFVTIKYRMERSIKQKKENIVHTIKKNIDNLINSANIVEQSSIYH